MSNELQLVFLSSWCKLHDGLVQYEYYDVHITLLTNQIIEKSMELTKFRKRQD